MQPKSILAPRVPRVPCENCGAPLYRRPSSSQRFCSSSCAFRYTKRDDVVIPRFWSYVDKNGPVPEHRSDLGPCWLWILSTDSKGYGHFRPRRKDVRTHTFAWELEHGSVPEGQCLLHQCDRPRCCRPSHLLLGTQLENIRDARSKGRLATGARHGSKTKPFPRRVFAPDQRAAIFERWRAGESQAAIARMSGLSLSGVNRIVHLYSAH